MARSLMYPWVNISFNEVWYAILSMTHSDESILEKWQMTGQRHSLLYVVPQFPRPSIKALWWVLPGPGHSCPIDSGCNRRDARPLGNGMGRGSDWRWRGVNVHYDSGFIHRAGSCPCSNIHGEVFSVEIFTVWYVPHFLQRDQIKWEGYELQSENTQGGRCD